LIEELFRMSVLGNDFRYGAVAQAIHWLTAILVLAAWLVAGTWEGGHPEMKVLHETLGLAVFALVVLRVVWRAVDVRPAEPPGNAILALLARVMHWALYALLIFIPLTAIIGSWLEGHALTIYALGNIGPFLTASRTLGHRILDVHQLLGTTIIWLAGLHAAAAIFHQTVLRDRTLRRMLPVG
jgi:cytochrome b561